MFEDNSIFISSCQLNQRKHGFKDQCYQYKVGFPTMWYVRQEKPEISLGIHTE